MTTPSVPRPRAVSFSTSGLPEAQKIALWEDHNAQALIGLRCRVLGETALDATELNLQLEQLHLARVRGNPHVVERPTEVIRRSPADAIAVYLTLAGEAFFYHDDGVLTLRPGQLLVCDPDRPFVRGFSRGLEEFAVKVPRAVFREVTADAALRAPLVRDVTGDVTVRSLRRLLDRALRADGGDAVDERLALDLVAALVGDGATRPAAVHLANARAFIEEHLTDPNLGAGRVAAAVGVSQRHLSRTFAGAGVSLPRFVLERRLVRARALLASSPDLSVGEVAARCGFGSVDTFSAAFREHFGVRATQVRGAARSA